ncbi:MAG: YggS family pyridoxal phosphate-dependent enzyme [Acidobacteriota bacterium]|nr:MAG: YggS family pyridoxal phosphate-dependent enzyme [Acidobacteriota bacterium]
MNDAGDAAAALKERLDGVMARMAEACRRAGRSSSDVRLVAVSKTVSIERIREAIEAGVRILGENRVQEAAGKIPALREISDAAGVAWHFIGRLQSNKARRAVEIFDFIESIDSLKLAERVNTIAGELGRRVPVLIEVNLGEEASKSGAAAGDVPGICERMAGLENLSLRGLMTVPPFLEDLEELRPFFRRLRKLRDEAIGAGIVGPEFTELSMGMSHDFEVAIEEGATMVRIGTAIFGPRA